MSRSKPPDPKPPPQTPLPWYEGAAPSDFIAWVYRELDAQGIDILDLPARFRVLDELVSWRDSFPNEAYSNLVNWNYYDADNLTRRSRAAKQVVKPRIAISAEITPKHNLWVRWHPAGFHEAEYDWSKESQGFNDLDRLVFRDPPDFRWFHGDETPYFDSRASNELMFIRGVGRLDPSPDRERTLPRRDLIDAMLVCAVRASYERLIKSLSHSFEVTVRHEFVFDIKEEDEQFSSIRGWSSTERVVGWSLRYIETRPSAEVLAVPDIPSGSEKNDP